MKLRNVLIVVNDIEKSIMLYHESFELDVILDNDGKLINLWQIVGDKKL